MTTGPKTTPRKESPTALPALTDPHLAALLLYVSGTHDDDDGLTAAEFAATLADTRELLTRQPLTNTFDWRLQQRSIEDQVRAAVAAKIVHTADPVESAAGRLLVDALSGDTEETIAVKRAALQTLVSDHIDAALLRGACVMYCLLQDGAR